MIQVKLRDGRTLDVEQITFTVTSGEELSPPERHALPDGMDETFTFDQIERFALLDGSFSVLGSKFGGMPIRVLRWSDVGGTDVQVDLPMPLDGAVEVGDALRAAAVVEVARTLPSAIVTPKPPV